MNLLNDKHNLLSRFLPPLVGIVLVLSFIRLGFWQLDRASEKIVLQQAFDNPRYEQVAQDLQPQHFQAIESRGHFLTNRQILIENAIVDGALGFYVITPFEFDAGGPLLLVNRGWIARIRNKPEAPAVPVEDTIRVVRGKSGALPRVGIRPGDAFVDHSSWPRIGVWPTLDEAATELQRELLPYVLLLDANEKDGFVRHWMPPSSGTSTHYGYAFQWFAMALALFGLMVWNFRKKAIDSDE